jgi:hypothetical protein
VDFAYTEEQTAILDLAEQILRDGSSKERLRELEAGPGPRFDRALWKKVAEAGLLAVAVPEAYDGAGLGFLEVAGLVQRVGRTAAALPLLETTVLGALPIARFGSDAQKQRWLPRVARGEAVLTAALTEPEGDPRRPATSALRDGAGFRLSGTKLCVPAAELADALLVPAATGDGRTGVFLVDAKSAGRRATPLATTAGWPEARIDLADVRVAAEDALAARRRLQCSSGCCCGGRPRLLRLPCEPLAHGDTRNASNSTSLAMFQAVGTRRGRLHRPQAIGGSAPGRVAHRGPRREAGGRREARDLRPARRPPRSATASASTAVRCRHCWREAARLSLGGSTLSCCASATCWRTGGRGWPARSRPRSSPGPESRGRGVHRRAPSARVATASVRSRRPAQASSSPRHRSSRRSHDPARRPPRPSRARSAGVIGPYRRARACGRSYSRRERLGAEETTPAVAEPPPMERVARRQVDVRLHPALVMDQVEVPASLAARFGAHDLGGRAIELGGGKRVEKGGDPIESELDDDVEVEGQARSRRRSSRRSAVTM